MTRNWPLILLFSAFAAVGYTMGILQERNLISETTFSILGAATGIFAAICADILNRKRDKNKK